MDIGVTITHPIIEPGPIRGIAVRTVTPFEEAASPASSASGHVVVQAHTEIGGGETGLLRDRRGKGWAILACCAAATFARDAFTGFVNQGGVDFLDGICGEVFEYAGKCGDADGVLVAHGLTIP
jgi:hypothetical protein